ncbi:MAG: ABC transporter permease subunit [Planctomycetota bacterium]
MRLRGLGPCFRAELSDLVRHPPIWVGLLVTAAATFFIGKTTPHRLTGWSVFAAAAAQGGALASFFLVYAGAGAVAGERTRGTVRFILPRPVARSALVLGKACALGVLCVLFAVLCLGSAALAAADRGFVDVPAVGATEGEDPGWQFTDPPEQDPNFLSSVLGARARGAALALLPALLTAAGLGLAVSSSMRSAAGAVFSALLLWIVIHYLPDAVGLSESAARVSPPAASEELWLQLRDFGRGLSSAQWPGYGALPALGAVVFVAGLPLLAAGLFSRAELTD